MIIELCCANEKSLGEADDDAENFSLMVSQLRR